MSELLSTVSSMFVSAARIDSGTLEEEDAVTHRKIMSLQINSNGCDKYLVYRFDPNNDNLFPFFPTHNAPRYLRCICDYFLFVEIGSRVYSILLELKQSSDSAEKQLEASSQLMQYFIRTARRLNINVETTSIIKVRIVGGKPTTRPQLPSYEQSSNYISYRWFGVFHIKSVVDVYSNSRSKQIEV